MALVHIQFLLSEHLWSGDLAVSVASVVTEHLRPVDAPSHVAVPFETAVTEHFQSGHLVTDAKKGPLHFELGFLCVDCFESSLNRGADAPSILYDCNTRVFFEEPKQYPELCNPSWTTRGFLTSCTSRCTAHRNNLLWSQS